jgi:hypothetical protein
MHRNGLMSGPPRFALHAWTPAGKVTCGSDFVGPILVGTTSESGRTPWLGRRPFWLKSASVWRSTAICRPTVTCRLNSDFLIFPFEIWHFGARPWRASLIAVRRRNTLARHPLASSTPLLRQSTRFCLLRYADKPSPFRYARAVAVAAG